MTTFESIYRSKLTTAASLVSGIKSGDLLHLGVWYGQPFGFIRALEDLSSEVSPLNLSVTFSLGPWAFFNHPGAQIETVFQGPIERESQRVHGNVSFHPLNYSEFFKMASQWQQFDMIVNCVTPMDERGRFNFSMTSSWEYEAVKWVRKHSPGTKVVFEVNPNLPRVFGLPECGSNEATLDDVDFIIENDAPLMEFPTAPPTDVQQKIAEIVGGLIENRSTLQLGFGTIPMAIGKVLARQHRDLGIHTEMFCDAHLDMIESGAVTNACKGHYDGMSVATFVWGTGRLHQFVKENREFAMLPASVVNSPLEIARNHRMTSVNSIIMIDLAGQTCAHSIGSRTYSGIGGAFDYAFGSQLAREGKSIVCLASTARLRDGRVVSNIVPQHEKGARITSPEHVTDWVVTEHGGVRLKLMNLEERAKALIGIAHPDFRDELARQAEANGLRIARVSMLRPPPAAYFSQPIREPETIVSA